ncbi:hypothetical protein QG37_02381 [Candidozyma auris]|nr:hypothetical protein QG37_02381 [[Candida] auris]
MGQRKNVSGRAGTLFLCDVGAASGLQTGKNISRLHLNRSDFFFIILVYKTPWAVIKKKIAENQVITEASMKTTMCIKSRP